MNLGIAQIALMYVLPLGITFITILQTASAEYRHQKIKGTILSLCVIAMDCMFYFAKNTFVSYNSDGGLLLAFASLFFLGILYVIRADALPAKIANGLFSLFMLTAFVGIAYWERPTLLVKEDFSSAEIARHNAAYQDYISSFENGEGGKWKEAPTEKVNANSPKATISEAAKGRLNKYVEETEKIIARMQNVMEAIDNFEPVAPNISDIEREERGTQALAINNNASSIHKKTLGLFHPHETTDAHAELIQATENLRLAAYSLYTYSLQEDTEQQMAQYKQSRNQIAQTKIYLERFRLGIKNLKQNEPTE